MANKSYHSQGVAFLLAKIVQVQVVELKEFLKFQEYHFHIITNSGDKLLSGKRRKETHFETFEYQQWLFTMKFVFSERF